MIKHIARVVGWFVGTFMASVSAIWGTLEAYSYFGGDQLKEKAGPYWWLIYVISLVIAFIITVEKALPDESNEIPPPSTNDVLTTSTPSRDSIGTQINIFTKETASQISSVYRTDIERGLDELISNEEGMKFQGLAVILAKQKWPDLIACERKWDRGLDARAAASLAKDGREKGLACSLTATLKKIKDDAASIKGNFSDLKLLIFATPVKVTNQTIQTWAEEIMKTFDYELIVMSREDIITSLMDPKNISLCRTLLGIPIVIEPQVEELYKRTLAAASELTDNWRRHPRLRGKPLISLRAIKSMGGAEQSDEALSLEGIQTLLTECRRIVLEAPAGRGKTTTLVQLATTTQKENRLSFLIDLREWTESGQDILDFIAGLTEFRGKVNGEELAKLSESTHFSFLLNGWNEIAESNSETADGLLRKLERSFPAAGIIVATRAHHLSPPLLGALRAELLSLSRAERTDYLQQRLGGRAEELINKLDNDPVLDELTRTFLILAEVATLFESNRPIPSTKIGVLSEVMRLMEQSEEHRNPLQRPPLRSRAQDYLEGLAFQMTTQGKTAISERDARPILLSVIHKLRSEGQVIGDLNPDDVLNTLCAHHVLERRETASVEISFEHQQFQEFYAAESISRELRELIKQGNQEKNREFIAQYIDKPTWEDPLLLAAEKIGMLSSEESNKGAEVNVGKLLVEMALQVDPIFAAKLSWLCGEFVWQQVRAAVAERLRSWYAVDDQHHKQCAIAGMLATGSDEFKDIIVPLLASDDDQVRLKTLRVGASFHLSTLGAEWRNVVRGWNEEARANFINELCFNRWMPPEEVANFVLSDPSPIVRDAVLPALWWVGAERELARILESLDEDNFDEAVEKFSIENIPILLRPRALTARQKLLNRPGDARNRLQILLHAGLSDTELVERIKQELDQLGAGEIEDHVKPVLASALKILQRTEPEWVSLWVANRVMDGSLWIDTQVPDDSLLIGNWIPFVASLPKNFKAQLLEMISSEDLSYNRVLGIPPLLAAHSDADLAEEIFAKWCAVRRNIASASGPRNETEHAIARQLEDVFRSLPPNVAVEGLAKCFANEFDIIEFNAVVEAFSKFDNEGETFRNELQEDPRQNLRRYLKSGLPFFLNEDDFQGGGKAYLATALAKIGDPEDIGDLRQLIQADMERIRTGIADRVQGVQSRAAMGAANRWDTWYVPALIRLNPDGAETVLLELLNVPEFENAAASGLLRLATTQDTENRLWGRTNYCVVWEAREGRAPRRFDEKRRPQYAVAVKQRISALVDERAKSTQQEWYDYRLVELTNVLAELDAPASDEFVFRVIELADKSIAWRRVEALESLVLGGGKLPTERTIKILSSVIEHLNAWGIYNDQNVRLFTRCLCLLAFVEEASTGISQVRQVISEKKLSPYHMREVVKALGCSHCEEAFVLLCELAGADGVSLQEMLGEWVTAVATLGSPAAAEKLLDFINPEVAGFDIGMGADRFGGDQMLIAHIADFAQKMPEIKHRIYSFCDQKLLPTKRFLLSKIIARLGTVEAVLAGLNLIDDTLTPQVPYDLQEAIESVFLERRPYEEKKNTFILEPRSSNEIKAHLFEMFLRDERRRKSAFNLLGRIEVLRLEYGRPATESRHPAFASGVLWPPI